MPGVRLTSRAIPATANGRGKESLLAPEETSDGCRHSFLVGLDLAERTVRTIPGNGLYPTSKQE